MEEFQKKHLRFNYIVNLMDGGFFGLALGFASFQTILPLFVSTLTTSAIWIGLVPAIHNMGWQLPQLLTARRISLMPRLRPFVLWLAIQERLPFVGLAIVAWLVPTIGVKAGLVLTYFCLVWQGLGAGLTANPWQNLIGKIIPSDYRATFFGFQSALANLLASGSAILAGFLLDKYDFPLNFTICFLLASFFLSLSWISIKQTREPNRVIEDKTAVPPPFWKNVVEILQKDAGFCWFLITRIMCQFGMMAFAFYIVFAVRVHHMTEMMAGVMTSVLFITQVIANPMLGWLADHWNSKAVIEGGAMAILLSATLAWLAPALPWFYAVFFLTGIANVAFWTIGMNITLDFGTEVDRPTYIGLANTLVAPSTIFAPLVGGWLADHFGFQATFMFAAAAGCFAAIFIHLFVRTPART